VVLLERRRFPRFHIGESLLPASNPVLRELGVEAERLSRDFVEKRGATFITECGEVSVDIDFTTCSKIPTPITYQVPRASFDQLLLDRAADAGVEVRQEHHVRDVTFDPGGVRLAFTGSDGDGELRAEAVVDASGQAGFLAKRLGLRRVDPELENVAVYAHFEGIPRPPGERAGDIHVVSRQDLGWIWLIPLPEGRTSVGVVLPRRRSQGRNSPAGEVLDRVLADTPALAERLRDARRVSPAHYEADFSYAPRAYAGDRWLLAGDAGSFLDPVFSTGVLMALEGGWEAAEAIAGALGAGDLSARSFARYQRLQEKKYRFFRRFVHGFYDPSFRDLFFQPSYRFGLVDTVTGVLAGNWRPSLSDRVKLALFFSLVAAQRHLPLARRIHGRRPAEKG